MGIPINTALIQVAQLWFWFYLQSENTRNLYAIPGLDYVAHEDVLPYKTDDKAPIQHELFDKFLTFKEDAGKLFLVYCEQQMHARACVCMVKNDEKHFKIIKKVFSFSCA